MDVPYKILDWRSYKLPRMSQSSLTSESQACALLNLWNGCVNPTFELRNIGALPSTLPSALVVDARALYDSPKAEVPQLQGDKRTKIEVMVTKVKIVECGTRPTLGAFRGAGCGRGHEEFCTAVSCLQMDFGRFSPSMPVFKPRKRRPWQNARRVPVGMRYGSSTEPLVPHHVLSICAVLHPGVFPNLVSMLGALGCDLPLFFANRWCTSRPSWTYESRSTAESGTQTSTLEDHDVRRRCQRASGLERGRRFRSESKLHWRRDKRMAFEEVTRRLELQLRLQIAQAASVHEPSHQLPIPAQIHISSYSGRKYHTNMGCTALGITTPKTYPISSFCANQSGLRVASFSSPPVRRIAYF